VAVLLDGFHEVGAAHVVFDGSGRSSGVYFARLFTPAGSVFHTMTLIR
jgi:hypothetical protein